MSDKVYVGLKCASFERKEEFLPVSRVTMWADEDRYYTAGDDTGRTIEVNYRGATQSIVDKTLEKLRGFVYRPYEAKGAVLDLAAEPGDAVTVGGIYSIIGHRTINLSNPWVADISAPGAPESGHEYEYLTPAQRELKRRVKLGQSYFGTKITRKDGLVIEKVIGEAVAARVVMNAEKLAFYDGEGQEQLYFDPVEGVYKFRGALNVNDNFVVDKLGNVVMKGGITLDGAIKWGTDNVPNKKRFAASTSGPWHETMQSGDIYCCDWDYVTNTWGSPYKFVGQDGRPGADGSDATIPKYITETVIGKGIIEAPQINATQFGIYPSSPSSDGSMSLYGNYGASQHEMFKLTYFAGDAPRVLFGSPAGAYANWEFDITNFYGQVDFSHAQVTGVTAVFA